MTAFSNGTAWDIWADRWCYQCKHDSMGRNLGDGDDIMCPIVTKVIVDNEVPKEWTVLDSIHQNYSCSHFAEYVPPDPDKPETLPVYEDPNQIELF